MGCCSDDGAVGAEESVVGKPLLFNRMVGGDLGGKPWWKVCASQTFPKNEDYDGLMTSQKTKNWIQTVKSAEIPGVTPWLECITCLVSGQAALTVILLAIMVQEASRNRDKKEEGKEEEDPGLLPSHVMIAFLVCLLVIFLVSIFRVFEKQARAIAFYAAFHQGVIIDFRNKFMSVRGKELEFTAGFKNIGALLMMALAGIAAYIFYEAAKAEGEAIAYVSVALALLTVFVQLFKLQAAYREMDVLEDHLISLPKFVESNPKLAREHLDACKMQDEGVCFARLSDIVNAQIYVQYKACVEFAVMHGYLPPDTEPAPEDVTSKDKQEKKNYPTTRCDRKGLVKKIRNNEFHAKEGMTKEALQEATKQSSALVKELDAHIKKRLDEEGVLFTWNMLRTADVGNVEQNGKNNNKPGSTHEGSIFKSTKLQKIVWKNNEPSVSVAAAFNVTGIFKGRYITLFEELKFKDAKMDKYSRTFVQNEQIAVFLFGTVFLLTFVQAFNFA